MHCKLYNVHIRKQLCSFLCTELVVSSPGHSQVFNVLRVTLKSWEWPGDEATELVLVCTEISLPPSFCVVIIKCAMLFMTSSQDSDHPDLTLTSFCFLSRSCLALKISTSSWHDSGGTPWLCCICLSVSVS